MYGAEFSVLREYTAQRRRTALVITFLCSSVVVVSENPLLFRKLLAAESCDKYNSILALIHQREYGNRIIEYIFMCRHIQMTLQFNSIKNVFVLTFLCIRTGGSTY